MGRHVCGRLSMYAALLSICLVVSCRSGGGGDRRAIVPPPKKNTGAVEKLSENFRVKICTQNAKNFILRDFGPKFISCTVRITIVRVINHAHVYESKVSRIRMNRTMPRWWRVMDRHES